MKKVLPFLIVASFIVVNCKAQQLESISVRTESAIKPDKLPLVKDGPIKNVILMIGDGTGLAQLSSGQLNLVGKEGLLYLQTLPVTGLVKTYSADDLITDSASGATAYSCGVKTDNGMIGQLPDGRACKTILELAEAKGLSTGLVSTSGVTHATPASFGAHVPSRSMQPEIAAQYLDTGSEVILGGGQEYFIPQSKEGSKRSDDRDLISEFSSSGYDYISTASELNSVSSDKLIGLFSISGMPSEDRSPTLAQMSRKAIDILSKDEDGFFLMIEASQIDWGGHDNDAQYVLREVKDYDAAVKEVIDFAIEDGETLVVLTADHETGGMTMQNSESEDELTISWTTGSHTGIPIPMMAYGPHAIEFTGWWENTEVGSKLARLLGLKEFPVIIEE